MELINKIFFCSGIKNISIINMLNEKERDDLRFRDLEEPQTFPSAAEKRRETPTFLCFIRFRVIEVGPTGRIHNHKVVVQNTIDIPLTIKAQQILRLNEVLRLIQLGHVSVCQTSTFHVAKQE